MLIVHMLFSSNCTLNYFVPFICPTHTRLKIVLNFAFSLLLWKELIRHLWTKHLEQWQNIVTNLMIFCPSNFALWSVCIMHRCVSLYEWVELEAFVRAGLRQQNVKIRQQSFQNISETISENIWIVTRRGTLTVAQLQASTLNYILPIQCQFLWSATSWSGIHGPNTWNNDKILSQTWWSFVLLTSPCGLCALCIVVSLYMSGLS